MRKYFDRDRTRTCNPQIRSLVPYPLGHTVLHELSVNFNSNITLLRSLRCNLCISEPKVAGIQGTSVKV